MPSNKMHINKMSSNTWDTTPFIGLSGKQYAGKDVVADLLCQLLPAFKKVPIALAIKQAYAKDHGLSLEEIEGNKAQHRPRLIEKGNWGRAQDPDYWLKQVLALSGQVIVSDVRLPREYELLKEAGAVMVRVEAHRDTRAQRGTIVSENDPTECALDNGVDWDMVIHNNGSAQELKEKLTLLFQS